MSIQSAILVSALVKRRGEKKNLVCISEEEKQNNAAKEGEREREEKKAERCRTGWKSRYSLLRKMSEV